jgi:hypothetical protein
MTAMAVTLFDLELNIVSREAVEVPPPLVLRRPRLVRWPVVEYSEATMPGEVEWAVSVFRYEGMGIYRQQP